MIVILWDKIGLMSEDIWRFQKKRILDIQFAQGGAKPQAIKVEGVKSNAFSQACSGFALGSGWEIFILEIQFEGCKFYNPLN